MKVDMKKWISFKKELPKEGEWILVTNNIKATDANGRMSHLWLTNNFYVTEGKYNAFSWESDNTISNVTHWRYALE